ncbi:hypothetical protein MKEN_00960600 [Mycena kentingensis (nom. inval.)]|nr:hypothetical protein MKEN_00960600 [Mycena kentingensis (nom. inval.)]
MRLSSLLPLGLALLLPLTGAVPHGDEAHSRALSLSPRGTFADTDFAQASWIWLPTPDLQTSAPAGTVGFLRSFTSPSGKVAAAASIALTADNNFTVFVNGHPIGASDPGSSWQNGQALIATLNATHNTIAVLAVNFNDSNKAPTPAGLLAFVRTFYTDGSNETFASDASWKVTGSIPKDWPLVSDTSGFVDAQVAFKYGEGPWTDQVSVRQSEFTSDAFSGSNWIWSASDAATAALAGSVGFRKKVPSPADKRPTSATVVATADNFFQLFINGRYISSPPPDPNAADEPIAGWQYASRVTTFFPSHTPSSSLETLTFDFFATNFLAADPGAGTTASSAGFIAAILITYSDGSSATIHTDPSWLASSTAASAAAFISTADASLTPASSLGAYGMAPWGAVGVADTVDAARVFVSGDDVGSGPESDAGGGGAGSASASGTALAASQTAQPGVTFSFTKLPDPSQTAAQTGAAAAPLGAGARSIDHFDAARPLHPTGFDAAAQHLTLQRESL